MDSPLKIGVHVSISGTIDQAVDRAKGKNCTTFQIFTRNPRGWAYKNLGDTEVKSFVKKCSFWNYNEVMTHMPYLPNLASPKDEVYLRSVESLALDLERTGALRIPYLVIHLGSHLGSGVENGVKRIVSACRTALEKGGNEVILLLENTAGQKNSLGSSFRDLGRIFYQIDFPKRIGICFDTCHAFAAGYDLRNSKNVRETLDELNSKIGLSYLKTVHLNDSKGQLGSRLDRHEHIGLGQIGKEGMKAVLQHEVIRKIPIVLETPIDETRDDVGNLNEAHQLGG
jgi:deoxyribonuclease-4